MLINIAKANTGQRVVTLRGVHRIIVQVQAPDTVRLGSNRQEVETIAGPVSDGLQIVGAGAVPNIFSEWWLGDLWVSSPNPNTNFILIILGMGQVSYV